MAQATGLTAEKTLELFEEMRQLIYGLGGSGTPLGDKISDLDSELEENRQLLEELNSIILPKLQEDLAKNDILLAQLNETDLVNLQSALDDNRAALIDLNTITLPNLQMDLDTSKADLDQFNTVTLPNLLDDLSGIQGLFPITETQISDGAITTPKMIANTINGDRILANTLLAEKIVAGSIGTDQMTANTINGDRITANTLNAAKIVAGTISTGHMTANTINGDRITANTLNANKISANTLSGDQIIANTINGDRIIANTISGDRIIANTINGNRIVANTINGDRIVANSIGVDKLKVNFLQGETIHGAYITGASLGGYDFLLVNNRRYFLFGDSVQNSSNIVEFSYAATSQTGMVTKSYVTVDGRVYGERLSMSTSATALQNGPNVFVDTNGTLFRSGSSSERYKRNIKQSEFNFDAWDQVEIVDYKAKPEFVPEGHDPEEVHQGVISEQLDRLGLTRWVGYEDGLADSVNYTNIIMPVLAMVQDLRRRVKSLEGAA